MLLWARWRGVPISLRDGTLVPGIAAGVLFGIEFVLIFRGLQFTTASRATLFIYTAPFFVALGARWFLPASGCAPCNGSGSLLSLRGAGRGVRRAARSGGDSSVCSATS